MDIDEQLLSTAERLFDREGFNATGMGRLVRETGLSSRTVYKHVGGKNALMAKVLAARQRRFFAHVDTDSVDALFNSLKRWIEAEGARGCLFFRLRAETGGGTPEIESAVVAYHTQLKSRLSDLVRRETGAADGELSDQMLVLFEGATTAATYRGAGVIDAACACARQLIAMRSAP